MLLKLMLALVPFLLLNETGGAGGEGEGNEGGENKSGGEGESGGEGKGASAAASGDGAQEPSANKLIKDFAKSRGITVEALLSSYEDLEKAGKTELQLATGDRDRYKADVERLTGEMRDLRSENAFVKAATDAGARDAETLFLAYKSRVDYDKAGKPTNIPAVIAQLKADKADLFRATTGTGGDGGRRGDTSETLDVNAALRGLKP